MQVKNPVILIADDEQVNVFLLAQLLRSTNYNIVAAGDGGKALEIAIKEHPDVVLLDIMMPEMDGFEVLHRIKTHTEIKHTPVIMVSAKTEFTDIEKAISLGAMDYMTKPVNSSRLISLVKNIIDVRNQ